MGLGPDAQCCLLRGKEGGSERWLLAPSFTVMGLRATWPSSASSAGRGGDRSMPAFGRKSIKDLVLSPPNYYFHNPVQMKDQVTMHSLFQLPIHFDDQLKKWTYCEQHPRGHPAWALRSATRQRRCHEHPHQSGPCTFRCTCAVPALSPRLSWVPGEAFPCDQKVK